MVDITRSRKVREFYLSDLELRETNGVYFKVGGGNMYFLNDHGVLFDAKRKHKIQIVLDGYRTPKSLREGESFWFEEADGMVSGTSRVTEITPIDPLTSAKELEVTMREFDRISGGKPLKEFHTSGAPISPLKVAARDGSIHEGISFKKRRDIFEGNVNPGDMVAVLYSNGTYIAAGFVSREGDVVRITTDRVNYNAATPGSKSIPILSEVHIDNISNSPDRNLASRYATRDLILLKSAAIVEDAKRS